MAQIPDIAAFISERLAALTTATEAVKAGGASIAIRTFREGFITPSELQAMLRTLGYDAATIATLLNQAQLEYNYDLLEDGVTALREAARKALITPDELATELATLGMNATRARTIADIETIRSFGKKPPATAAGG